MNIMEKGKPNKRPGRPRGATKNKMTKVQVEEFITESIVLIMNSHLSYKEFIKHCKDTKGLSENQSNIYWKRVFELIKEKYSLQRDEEIDKHLFHLWMIYGQSIDKGDFNTARQILGDISKLKGLNEPDKLDMTSQNEIIFKFGTEE